MKQETSPRTIDRSRAVYHVMSRGNRQSEDFRDEGDCEMLLETLSQTVLQPDESDLISMPQGSLEKRLLVWLIVTVHGNFG